MTGSFCVSPVTAAIQSKTSASDFFHSAGVCEMGAGFPLNLSFICWKNAGVKKDARVRGAGELDCDMFWKNRLDEKSAESRGIVFMDLS
jgi:hypothetical protein